MSPYEVRLVRNTALTVLSLVVLRLVAAAWTPLTFDEAYYWMWSKHLAGGYYDHPPMVAFVIRAGTAILGDTELGVRLVSILLALPMSFAVYRTATILFGGMRVAANATILLNVTLMAAVGTLIVTPDAPLLVASSFVLFFLAKVLETGRGACWLAVGAAVGCALLSKYTALFFGPAILIWLALVPKLRRWLISLWPYLGGLVALAIFSPVILWNADHHWVSFIKQIGRARIEDFKPAFIGELIPTQIAFATPLVFILGAMGLYALFRRTTGALAARMLINTNLWTIVAYFIWHSLHARVEANWFAPVYPAFAIAAAVAANPRWDVRQQRVVDFCLRWAAPTGILMFALLIVQANTGVLSGYRRDATVRSVGVGWRELASEIEAVRARVGAGCVLAPDYGTTGWLAFYLPKGSCVAQQNQRIRWVNMPEPDPAQLSGKLLYVDEARPGGQPFLKNLFARVERVAELKRKRGPLVIETYALDLLESPNGSALDRSPPPELE
jgi:4-amino-4-deoxy-L-arabinose transferase-like glycosyltransferase